MQTDPDFQAGEVAVQAKDWHEVIARMSAVTRRDPRNADAWNELGHAHRLTGDMDDSFRDYQKALQINPRHRGAHEYLGEAYLQVGKVALAEAQLKVLDKLCSRPCEEYSDLKEKVQDYKHGHPQTAGL